MFLLTVFIFFYFLYQNNLKNRELWLRVTNMMETLDYAPPVLVIENDDRSCRGRIRRSVRGMVMAPNHRKGARNQWQTMFVMAHNE